MQKGKMGRGFEPQMGNCSSNPSSAGRIIRLQQQISGHTAAVVPRAMWVLMDASPCQQTPAWALTLEAWQLGWMPMWGSISFCRISRAYSMRLDCVTPTVLPRLPM